MVSCSLLHPSLITPLSYQCVASTLSWIIGLLEESGVSSYMSKSRLAHSAVAFTGGKSGSKSLLNY